MDVLALEPPKYIAPVEFKSNISQFYVRLCMEEEADPKIIPYLPVVIWVETKITTEYGCHFDRCTNIRIMTQESKDWFCELAKIHYDFEIVTVCTCIGFLLE